MLMKDGIEYFIDCFNSVPMLLRFFIMKIIRFFSDLPYENEITTENEMVVSVRFVTCLY